MFVILWVYSSWTFLTANSKLRELVGLSPNDPACTSDCFFFYFFGTDLANLYFLLFNLLQNAGEGLTEHVQKGAAADCLYGVAPGTTD